MTKLQLEPMAALVDEMDNEVNEAYAAWPERLYIVDSQGNIVVQREDITLQVFDGGFADSTFLEFMGLELAAVIMIFTGQAWNMVFSFYSSVKSVPGE